MSPDDPISAKEFRQMLDAAFKQFRIAGDGVQGSEKNWTINPGCCEDEVACPEKDIAITIAGESCALVCALASGPVWITTVVDFTGARDLPFLSLGQYGVNFNTGLPITQFTDAGCTGESQIHVARVAITVICNADPNDSGKRLGLYISISNEVGAGLIYVLNLQDDPANWFNFSDTVVASGPCGDFTIRVTAPA